jgi:hypothetical protein
MILATDLIMIVTISPMILLHLLSLILSIKKLI